MEYAVRYYIYNLETSFIQGFKLSYNLYLRTQSLAPWMHVTKAMPFLAKVTRKEPIQIFFSSLTSIFIKYRDDNMNINQF